MNIANMKSKFPNHKITDASDRNSSAIIKICDICISNKKLIVFLCRNQINDGYFKMIEQLNNTVDLKFIIINEDNYYHK